MQGVWSLGRTKARPYRPFGPALIKLLKAGKSPNSNDRKRSCGTLMPVPYNAWWVSLMWVSNRSLGRYKARPNIPINPVC